MLNNSFVNIITYSINNPIFVQERDCLLEMISDFSWLVKLNPLVKWYKHNVDVFNAINAARLCLQIHSKYIFRIQITPNNF